MTFLTGSSLVSPELKQSATMWPGQELLALGERIGIVNTGLPEDVFSKCLVETRCHSSDKAQEETSCAICLVSNSCINGD